MLNTQLGLKEISENVEDLQTKANTLASWIQQSNKVIFLTGAGISTSADIPDYRGPDGVWTRKALNKEKHQISAFLNAKPTFTHRCLQAFHAGGLADFLISTNVDGLHIRSGWNTDIVEIHGNAFQEICWACHTSYFRPFEVQMRSNGSGKCHECKKKVPFYCHCTGRFCKKCGEELKDTINHFNEPIIPEFLKTCKTQCAAADLTIVLGTSLSVAPTCHFPMETRLNGGKFVLVNLQPTQFDKHANMRVYGSTDEFMKMVSDGLGVLVPDYDPKFDGRRLWEYENAEAEIQKQQNLQKDWQEIMPEGAVAVIPSMECTHCSPEILKNYNVNSFNEPCSICGNHGENMLCVTCGKIFCGRHKKKHALQHFSSSDHCIAIGLDDLSIWCYKCDSYVDDKVNESTRNLYRELHMEKFGCEPGANDSTKNNIELTADMENFDKALQDGELRRAASKWLPWRCDSCGFNNESYVVWCEVCDASNLRYANRKKLRFRSELAFAFTFVGFSILRRFLVKF